MRLTRPKEETILAARSDQRGHPITRKEHVMSWRFLVPADDLNTDRRLDEAPSRFGVNVWRAKNLRHKDRPAIEIQVESDQTTANMVSRFVTTGA